MPLRHSRKRAGLPPNFRMTSICLVPAPIRCTGTLARALVTVLVREIAITGVIGLIRVTEAGGTGPAAVNVGRRHQVERTALVSAAAVAVAATAGVEDMVVVEVDTEEEAEDMGVGTEAAEGAMAVAMVVRAPPFIQ